MQRKNGRQCPTTGADAAWKSVGAMTPRPNQKERVMSKQVRKAVGCVVDQLESRTMMSASLVNGVLTVSGTAGHDHLTVEQGSAGIYVMENGVRTNIMSSGKAVQTLSATSVKSIVMNGYDGHDHLGVSFTLGTKPAKFYGGDGNDEVVGGYGNDQIWGGAGNDTISGRNGNDYIHGGTGNDTLKGGSGNDEIICADDTDTAYGNSGNDTLSGGEGSDNLYGGSDKDQLAGGTGDDGLFGGEDADTLTGGTGDDRFLQIYSRSTPNWYTTIQTWNDIVTDLNSSDARIGFQNHVGDYEDDDSIYRGGIWSDEHIQAVDIALTALHRATGNTALLKSPTADDGILVFVRLGARVSGEGMDGNNDGEVIRLTDSAFNNVDHSEWGNTVQTTLHEVGHNFDGQRGWNELSGWTTSDRSTHPDFDSVTAYGKRWYHWEDADFVSTYARTGGPLEDFAESFAAHLITATEETYANFTEELSTAKAAFIRSFINLQK
jgi:hypothetical protein